MTITSDEVDNSNSNPRITNAELFVYHRSNNCSTNEQGKVNEFTSLDQCLEAYALADYVRGQNNNKRQRIDHDDRDMRPLAFVRLNTRLGKPSPTTIRALLDSGASETLVASRFVSKLRVKDVNKKPTVWSTPAGELKTTQKVRAQFTIPELQEKRLIEWDVHVVEDMGAYDMIIGRDILSFLGIDIQFSTRKVSWDGIDMPFKPVDATPETHYHIEDAMAVNESTERIKQILDAKYEAADLEKVCAEQDHLALEERRQLLALLNKYSDLFDGTLGKWKLEPVELELKEGATPYHARPYPIPKCHYDTLRMEVDRLEEIGVLKRVNRSEWAAPSFIIPKKDGTVRFINDFRELNKRIRRKPFPIPNIQDMLLNLEGFQYATSLDLNMGYYHIELSPTSKQLCTLVFPFGKYEMQRLPMGLCNSPDIFQEKMSELFEGLEFVRTYIDDLLCLTKGNFEDHLEKLERILYRLQQAGLKVNGNKSFFAKTELEYLGYWITRQGMKPLPGKVKAILALETPSNRTELRSFIGIVNYYRDMWIRRSHVLGYGLIPTTIIITLWHCKRPGLD